MSFISPLQAAQSRSAGHDRAAVVTAAIILIVTTALRRFFAGDWGALASVRAEIESILRDEFFDIARMTRDEMRLAD